MRKGYWFLMGFCFVAATMLNTGCGSDPVVRAAIVELRAGAVTIMDDRDAEAAKAGDAPLPKEYRDDKLGAYDDLIDYLDGKKPEAVGK